MRRRILGPIGGPIAFFLVAGLVFAVLGWVTRAALRVEQAQREDALRADREKDLRIALGRLDGRMLPTLGIEDTRPFHEYKTYSADDPITLFGPGCAPLLAADLPDWMQLHFQVDPEASWESPQVLTQGTRLSLRRNWPELPLRNATKARAELMASLVAKFPARQVGDAFATRERALPALSPPIPPISFNGVEDGAEFPGEPKEPRPLKREEVPAPAVVPAVPIVLPPAAIEGTDARLLKEKTESLSIKIKKTEEQSLMVIGPPAPALTRAPEPQASPVKDSFKEDGKPANRGTDQKLSGYEERNQLRDQSINELRGAGNRSYLSNGLAQNSQSAKGNSAPPPPASGPLAETIIRNSAAKPPLAEGYDRNAKGATTSLAKPAGDMSDKLPEKKDKAEVGRYAFNPQSPEDKRRTELDFKKVEAEPLGFYRMIEAYKQTELARRQADDLHRGSLRQDGVELRSEKKDVAKSLSEPKAEAMAKAMPGMSLPGGFGALPPPGAPSARFGLGGGVAPGGFPPPGLPASVALAPGGGAGGPAGPLPKKPAPESGPIEKAPVVPTPDPVPPAKLEPAELPVPPPPAMIPPMLDDVPAPQPVAVHLGSMRPQWITAPDGTEVLVVVRAARVENKKTIYQGVVLDWAKLQDVLKAAVQDLFPDATLVPVKEPSGSSREQSMTALPIHLDPGPTPEPPPAGWTPLRIGLVLAWIAAAIAFTAVGLSGWSLIDLAERRIRFVSAVTHELRTPLTSLRLYLDLLLSGMVQDEEKRREYLSTLNVESDRLHRLIDNVLDYARLERRRKGRVLQAMPTADFLEQIRRTWTDRVAADGKELVVISTLPPELAVMTDEALVQQIVGNLIDNARKYTRDATDPRIWLWARIENANRVVFEVEDRGSGVAAKDQKVIFRAFRRGETADAKAGGAGLGLALSKEWAEVVGGKLTYRGAEGGIGSCFRLELPVK